MNPKTPIGLEEQPEPDHLLEKGNSGPKGYLTAAGMDEPPEHPRHPAKPSGRGWLWFVAIVIIVAAAVYYEWPRLKNSGAPQQEQGQGKRRGGKNGDGGPISVVAEKASRGNIGVYYTALGAVTPIYTVTVKSRVDGQLMKVLFTEGQIVHQGDPLIEIDPRPYQAVLDQAEGNMGKDQALLANAKLDLERYKTLFAQQAVPQQQLATQDALVKQYDATIKADQATVEAAKLNLTYSHITSPITGLVGLRLVDPGNIVHASDANGLVVITQLDPISVIFTLAEDQLPTVLDKMHAGQHLGVEAWDRDLKARLGQGKLQTIDNQIDPTTGTLKLRADFDNKQGKLFPSQFVNARLLVEERYGITLIPNAAVQRNTQSTYVWLVKPDATVTVRPVTLGVSENEQTQVMSGLNPGDELVTVGVDRLQEGSKVNVEIPKNKAQAKKPASASHS